MIWNNKMSIYTEFKNFSNIFFMYLMFDPYKALTLIINPPYKVDVDTTIPLIENVAMVTWTNPDRKLLKQICQIPWTYVDVNVSVLEDNESGLKR